MPKKIDLSQECVLFTGTLNAYPRKVAQQLVLAAGGQVLNYGSTAVTLLVVGMIDKGLFAAPTTRKLTWAQAKGVPIIGEKEFMQLIETTH